MKSILVILLLSAVALTTTKAQEIIVVKATATSPENAVIPLLNIPNGTVMTVSHNTRSANLIIQCRNDAGTAINTITPLSGFTNSTIQIIFPASGGPFNGKCFINGNGGIGEQGGPGPAGPASLQMPPIDYDPSTIYSATTPAQVVRYNGSSWTPKQPTVGPGSVPVEGSDWALLIPKGDPGDPGTAGPGFCADGDPVAWSNSTAYTPASPGVAARCVYSAVTNSTYRCIAANTGVPPNTDPSKWALISAPAAGTGDVVGPSGGVTNGQLPLYSSSTGKALSFFTGTGIVKAAAGAAGVVTGAAGDMVQQDMTSTAPSGVLVVDTGIQNAAAGCPAKAATLRDGLVVALRAIAANTGAAAFNYCSSGSKAIKDGVGSDLASGDLTQYTSATPKHNLLIYSATSNGSNGWWELVKTGGGGGGGLPSQTGNAGYFLSTNSASPLWVRIAGIDSAGNPDGTVLAELNGNNTWTGHEYHTPPSIQSITAASTTVLCNAAEISVAPTALFALTSTPQVAAGAKDKQRCRLVNNATSAAFSITLADRAGASGSGLVLQSPQVTIPGSGRFIDLEWNATELAWVQSGVASSATPNLPVTTRGDLLSFTTQSARLGAGTQGQFLASDVNTAAGTNPSGLKWQTLIDTDPTLAANSNALVPSQAAVKAFAAQRIWAGNATPLNSGSAIAVAQCVSSSAAATGADPTQDVPIASFSGDPTGTVGYQPGAMLTVIPWITTNTINFKVCNNTASPITPAAMSVNWKILR